MIDGIENFPTYFEKFAVFYEQLSETEWDKENVQFHAIGWNMAIFSHAVKNKEFRVALSYLEKTVTLLDRLKEDNGASEVSKKLYNFSKNLKNQFERFLQSKKNASLF